MPYAGLRGNEDRGDGTVRKRTSKSTARKWAQSGVDFVKANGSGSAGMNWFWRGLVLLVILGGIKHSWGEQDKKIDSLGLTDTTIMEKVGENTAAIAEVKTDIAVIKKSQENTEKEIGEIKTQIQNAEEQRREDQRELMKAINAKNGNP